MVYLHVSDKHKEGKDSGCLYRTASQLEEMHGAVLGPVKPLKSLSVSGAKGMSSQLESSRFKFCTVVQTC